jgi:hypothetical protein
MRGDRPEVTLDRRNRLPAAPADHKLESMTGTIRSNIPDGLSDAINDGLARTVGIAGLGGIALIHVLQLPEAFAEAAYLGGMFIAAIVAAVVLAAIVTRTSDRHVWAATGVLPALILLGYVLSRTSGLPDATNDVGEWSEPLGLASLVVESLLVCLTVGVLMPRRQPDPAGTPARLADSGQRP